MTVNVDLVDVEGRVVTVESVKADIEDVRWAILKRVVHLRDLLPASVVVLVEDVVLLLRRKITHGLRGSGLVESPLVA